MLPLNDATLVIGGYRGDSALLMFVDPAGNPLFQRTFKATPTNQAMSDLLCDIRLDSEGFIYGCGVSRNFNTTVYRGFAFRYNYITNNLSWVTVLEHPILPVNTFAFNVQQPTPGEDYYVMGQHRLGGGGENGYMVTLDRNTGLLGASPAVNLQYDIGSSETFAASVVGPIGPTGRPDLFVTGRYTNGAGTNFMRESITRFNAFGGQIWSRSYYVPTNLDARQYSYDIILENNTLVICGGGDRNGVSAGITTATLSQQDLGGTMIWGTDIDITTPGFNTERIMDVIRVADGYVGYGENRNARVFLVKTDFNGAVQWIYEYEGLQGSTHDIPYIGQNQLIEYRGSLYFVGDVRSPGDITKDVVLFKVEMDGTLSDDCQFPLTHNAIFYQPNYAVQLTPSQPDATSRLQQNGLISTGFPDFIQCENNGCWAASDSNFTIIDNPITITDHQIWEGQVYIGDDVIVTVDGANALLDMTNVDIVFGECAGIDFINGAHIRANNSVFRPCDEPADLYAWRGLQFGPGSTGEIDECTFKRARRAINFRGFGVTPTIDIRVSNNHFVNNEYGIIATNADLVEVISGNTFLIDDDDVDYNSGAACQFPAYTNTNWGIAGFNTDFGDEISQNNFINSAETATGKAFNGIFMQRSSGVISFNHFTNNFSAVQIGTCNSISVENNRMECT
ncbi:MAG: hypothetical protein AAF570_15250, partial [Bacteroidota bacterium]